jgi:MFS family permease
MLLHNPAIRVLFIAQALYWSCSMVGITLTALIGLQLAPLNALATLPLALLVVGNLLAVQPLSLFMQRKGRRAGFLLGSLGGVAGGLLSAVAIVEQSFLLLCLGALPIGVYQASAMYYRFAAQDAVDERHRGRAAAYVLGGGVLAALIAPELAVYSRNALPVAFSGAFVLIALLAFAASLLLWLLPPGSTPPPPARGGLQLLRALLARPQIRAAMTATAVGHGLMILVMTATPLAMNYCGLPLQASAEVIRWHVLGMFLPAFFAGPLVDRLGCSRVIVLGCLVLGVSATVALSGLAQGYFLLSSFLLGFGWNLLLVAGTTLLGQGHADAERGHAQGLMELGNGLIAAIASFASAALLGGLGWKAVNFGMLPLLAVILLMLVALRKAGRQQGTPQ